MRPRGWNDALVILTSRWLGAGTCAGYHPIEADAFVTPRRTTPEMILKATIAAITADCRNKDGLRWIIMVVLQG